MPVAPPAVTAAIIAAGPGLKGPSWFRTARGIGVGVVAWSLNPINVVVVGSVNGTLGAGVVTGKFTLPPVPAPVVASLAAVGLIGPASAQIGVAVGTGVGTSYSAAGMYTGASVGAIGADVSKVVFANPATLVPSLIGGLASAGLVGPSAARLAAGLAPGIATMFMTGFGVGAAAGPAGPAPGTGVSKSSII